MENFSIGQTVRVTGSSMKGMVGTVVHHDEKQSTYLVRVGGSVQNYFPADEIEPYRA